MNVKYIEDPGERQRRLVEVAKDVLVQLDTQRLLARNGCYLMPYYHGDKYSDLMWETSPTRLQQRMKKFAQCDVCAIGSIFISYVEQFDGISAMPSMPLLAPDAVYTLFGLENMHRVEAAFEMWTNDPAGQDRDVVDWIHSYGGGSSDDRLRMIMQNIIDNGGKFLGVDPGK